MGSYASFKIKDYEVLWMKSYISPLVASLFIESDRIEKDDGNDKYRYIYYQTNVETIKKRLDIMGFNLETLKCAFHKSKRCKLDNLNEKNNVNFLDKFTFEEYLIALKKFMTVR